MQNAATLNEPTRGWLHHLWRKATTEDDWSSSGAPNLWWDSYSMPPMLSFARFDLEIHTGYRPDAPRERHANASVRESRLSMLRVS